MLLSPLSASEIFWRLCAAFVAGALLGFERETHGRPAGLRTTILSSVAACAATILAWEFAVSFRGGAGSYGSDPARLVAGILTGIGFLGAGAIMRNGSQVQGVTTAAVLWLSTIIGLVFGGGEWVLGLITLAFAGLALCLLPPLERHIAHHQYARLTITSQGECAGEAELRKIIESSQIRVQKVAFAYDFLTGQRVVHFDIRFESLQIFEHTVEIPEKLRSAPGVVAVAWD
jgi:putative Mg2+ transporter-C (MgtC) family protein